MQIRILRCFAVGLSLALGGANALAAELSPEIKAKVDAKVTQFGWISTDAKVVAAIKEYNASPPAEYRAMTNDKWKSLTVLDPLVRALSKNALAEYLKTKKDDSAAELFVSGADGGRLPCSTKPRVGPTRARTSTKCL
jgi:hypothetical protein